MEAACSCSLAEKWRSERRQRREYVVQVDGGVVTDEQEIHNLITDYYKTLFLSHAGDRYEEVLQQFARRVTQEMNQTLTHESTDQEINNP